MLDEIFEIVSKKRKLPVTQIKLIYRSFTEGVRYYVTNPFVSKGVIRIPNLGAFKMTHRSITQAKKHSVEELQEYTKQFKRKKNATPS